MLQALYQIPRDKMRQFIVWAIGGEPLIKQPEPAYDPAALDKVAASLNQQQP